MVNVIGKIDSKSWSRKIQNTIYLQRPKSIYQYKDRLLRLQTFVQCHFGILLQFIFFFHHAATAAAAPSVSRAEFQMLGSHRYWKMKITIDALRKKWLWFRLLSRRKKKYEEGDDDDDGKK